MNWLARITFATVMLTLVGGWGCAKTNPAAVSSKDQRTQPRSSSSSDEGKTAVVDAKVMVDGREVSEEEASLNLYSATSISISDISISDAQSTFTTTAGASFTYYGSYTINSVTLYYYDNWSPTYLSVSANGQPVTLGSSSSTATVNVSGASISVDVRHESARSTSITGALAGQSGSVSGSINESENCPSASLADGGSGYLVVYDGFGYSTSFGPYTSGYSGTGSWNSPYNGCLITFSVTAN